VVKTASVWQARQPVYKTSVERWRRYEPWLGELRELLPATRAHSTELNAWCRFASEGLAATIAALAATAKNSIRCQKKKFFLAPWAVLA
jgi:hypothetical protein